MFRTALRAAPVLPRLGLRLAIGLVLGVLYIGPALADALDDAREAAWDDVSMIGVASIRSHDGRWTVLQMASLGGSKAGPSWGVRRIDGAGETVLGSQAITSTKCPTIRPALEALQKLPLPAPVILGLGQPRAVAAASPPSSSSPDGGQYKLSYIWGEFPDGSLGDAEIKSNNGAPLANWFDATMKSLEPCWKPA